MCIKKCASQSLVIHDLTNGPSFGLQALTFEIAGETVKLLRSTISTPKKMKIKHQIPEMDFYFDLFEEKQIHSAQYCYSSTIFERHLARIATVILHRPPRLNILLLYTCRCVRNHFVQQLDHFFVRNWSTNCNRLHGIPDRGTRFYVE